MTDFSQSWSCLCFNLLTGPYVQSHLSRSHFVVVMNKAILVLVVLSLWSIPVSSVWAPDNYALDFGDVSTYGAYDCGNDISLSPRSELTIEAWINPRWPTSGDDSSRWASMIFLV